MAGPGPSGRAAILTRMARGGAFAALLLGLILFADSLSPFLGARYWWIVVPHIAVGLLAIGTGYLVVQTALRMPRAEDGPGRIRSLGILAVAVLTVLLFSGLAVLIGALTTGVLEAGRIFHLVMGFLAIASLVALGLAARASLRTQ